MARELQPERRSRLRVSEIERLVEKTMAKPKIHLFESDEPEQFKNPLKAVCGHDIKRPKLEFRLDGDLQQVSLSTIGNCQNCADAELSKRYIYGVRDSQ